MNYVIRPTSKDITHHGILGQKWGKRQGPPYPLDGSDHSAAEQKAGWKNSLDKKASRIAKKYDKKISRSKKYNDSISEARAKNRSRIESKYDKKISKIKNEIKSYDPNTSRGDRKIKALEEKKKAISDKKRAKIKDFDEGTKIISKSDDIYTGIIKDYKNMKIASVYDNDIRKSPKYKDIKLKYMNQVASDIMYYGQPGTTLNYANDIANQRHKYTTKSTNISYK